MTVPRPALAFVLICLTALTLPAAARPAAPKSYAERPEARAFIEHMADAYGFERAELLRLFRDARPLSKVIRAIMPPADPRVRSWQRYRARYVEPVRIEGGLRFWQAHQATLDEAQRRYGVPPEIIVAIIGVETIYGRHTGNFPALSALATLAFDYPPRADLFRRELEELLLLARESGRDARSYRGSYAGALGIPQFLPSSIRRYATDFDGDARIELSASPQDAIGSVARFLAEHGWRSGERIAVPASTAGSAVDALIARGIEPTLAMAELAAAGITTGEPAGDELQAALVDLVTPDDATEYWLGFRNFYVITRYNRSSFYAMAVFQLGEALRQARQP